MLQMFMDAIATGDGITLSESPPCDQDELCRVLMMQWTSHLVWELSNVKAEKSLLRLMSRVVNEDCDLLCEWTLIPTAVSPPLCASRSRPKGSAGLGGLGRRVDSGVCVAGC
jgi:hypothetical protein